MPPSHAYLPACLPAPCLSSADTLVLARVMWFAAQGSASRDFKIVWCSLMAVVQVVYIVSPPAWLASCLLACLSACLPARCLLDCRCLPICLLPAACLHVVSRLPLTAATCLLLPACLQFVAVLAYRQFGWRLYSKLGVDYREKGAAEK